MERAGAPFRKFSEGRKPERRSGIFSPGISITPPLSGRILGHYLRFGTFLKDSAAFKKEENHAK
jgi:hypothetical protein